MKLNTDKIQDLRNNGYSLKFETVFNVAFENYKKIVVYASLLLLVFAVFFGIALFLVIAFTYGLDNFRELIKPENLDPKNFSESFIINYLIGTTVFSCLISPFFAGFIKMAHCAEIDEEFHVSTVFEFYKWKYFKQIVLATLMITIISMGISSMVELTGMPALGIFTSLIISCLNLLTVSLIIFSNFNAIEAINTSFNLTSKHLLLLLTLMLVSSLFCLVGFFFFFIGFFFTVPFLFSMNYAIYKTIIGFNE